jgi:hypothetical protein
MFMHLILTSSSSIGWPEISAVIGVISAAILAFVGLRKLGPEKDSIYISTAQGANVILKGLNDTLAKELEREREKVTYLEAEVERLKTENANLKLGEHNG